MIVLLQLVFAIVITTSLNLIGAIYFDVDSLEPSEFLLVVFMTVYFAREAGKS